MWGLVTGDRASDGQPQLGECPDLRFNQDQPAWYPYSLAGFQAGGRVSPLPADRDVPGLRGAI